MNIFLTSFNPKEAASHLDDLRLNKMILETAQLLSSAYRHLFGDDELLYKDTHLNHPCSIWARKNIDSYSWLVEYFDALAKEKIKRDQIKKLDKKQKKSKLINLGNNYFSSLKQRKPIIIKKKYLPNFSILTAAISKQKKT